VGSPLELTTTTHVRRRGGLVAVLGRCVVTLQLVALVPRLAAQVETELPPVVPGAKPVRVERIKVHGVSLEGNLEGNAVDRDVIVFLPTRYEVRRAGATRSFMRCTATPSAPSSGRRRSTSRRRSKVLSRRARGT